MPMPGPVGLWNYLREYPGRYADQFSRGMQQFAATRNPVAALGALNPTTPFIQDAALQAGGLIAPHTNRLSQAISQSSENLGLGPLSIPEVTDEQLAPLLMLGMAGRGGLHRRVNTTGKYAGSPGITSPQQLAAWRKKYKDMFEQGMISPKVYAAKTGPAHWYELGAKGIGYGAMGDVDVADAWTQAAATTSPSTPVKGNAEYAVRAHNQAMAGYPISAGIFPNKMSPELERLYNYGEETSGRKRVSFHGNIMHLLDPLIPQGTTVDVWMMRAGGYGKDAPTDAQYEFMERETRLLADRMQEQLGLPVTEKNVQAAIWSYAKARKEGKTVEEAGYNFADALQDTMAQLSWESAPGQTSAHLQGYHSAPLEQKAQFHTDMSNVLTDESGRDLVSSHLGLMQGPGIDVTGAFKGILNPGTQSQAALAAAAQTPIKNEAEKLGWGTWIEKVGKGGKITRDFRLRPDLPEAERTQYWYNLNTIDAASRELADVSEAVRGILLRQDGVAWHRPFSLSPAGGKAQGAPLYASNLAELDIGRPLNEQETVELYQQLIAEFGETGYDLAPVGSPVGARILNHPFLGLDNKKEFQPGLKRALKRAKIEPNIDLYWGGFDGNYVENNWSENPNGEIYREVIERSSDQTKRRAYELLAGLGPKVEGVEAKYERELGWSPDRSTHAWRTTPEINQVGQDIPPTWRPSPRKPWETN